MEKDELKHKIFRYHNEKVKATLGIDTWDTIVEYSKIGNSPGIEVDSILMYYHLIKDYKLKKIVEFGSGFSTLIFSIIAEKLGIEFHSFEEEAHWLDITKKLLTRYNKDDSVVKLFDKEAYKELKGCDFCFVDSNAGLRLELLNAENPLHNNLRDIGIVIVDDMESLGGSCSLFMAITGRTNFYVFNATGRSNRHQFINSNFKEPLGRYFLDQKRKDLFL